MNQEQVKPQSPIRVGRITAALLLVSVGVLMLLDQIWHTSWITLLITWWPLILICWGIEVIWFGLRKSERRWKLDILGMFGAVFISAIVFTAAQPNLFQDWIRSIQFDFSMMKQMVLSDGIKIEQAKITEALTTDASSIQVNHTVGDIYVKSGDVEQLELSSLVTVYNSNKDQAQELADRIHMKIEKNAKLGRWTIKAEGINTLSPSNANIRLDIQILLPADSSLPLQIKLDSGDIYVQDFKADVQAITSNGDIFASYLGGKAALETRNGDIDVKNIAGDAVFTTLNGDIQVSDASGAVHMETKSGDLDLHEALGEVIAESLNGDITLTTAVMGGAWNIQALAGDVMISLPENADMTVNAHQSFGEAETSFPLTITEQSITGVIGSGYYDLTVEANGDIAINASQ